MQIHGADPVVIGCVSAVFAAEDMVLLVAVTAGHMPALRAGLGGVGRIDCDNGLTILKGLVDQLLLQVIIGPGDRDIPVPDTDTFGGRADAGQILQDEEGTLGVVLSECLADAVIHITHETVFSLADGFEPPSGGWGLHLLQLPAKGLVVGALLLDGRTGEEGAPAFAVISSYQEADPPVDTDDVRDIGGGDLVELLRHRDVEKEPAVLIYQLRGAETPVDIDALCEEGDLDPSLQGTYGEQGPVPVQRIVPVPDEIHLRLVEADPDPVVLTGQDSLVSGDDGAQDRLGHLGTQAETPADGAIELPVQGTEAQVMEEEDMARHEITGSRIGVHGIDQKLSVLLIRKDLQFGGKCLFHRTIIPQRRDKRKHMFAIIH